ncbi:MAG: response regulator [Alkalilacustris sp.]
MGVRENLHILIVDDMSTSRGLITQAMDELGITNYDTENDGASALKRLATRPVHLVISDFNMPGMNGLELLGALRQGKATQKIGFILITGRADKELLTKGQALGMNNYLAKPFTTAQMKTCIERVVGPL